MFEQLIDIAACCLMVGKDMATEFPPELMKLLSVDTAAYMYTKVITEAVNFAEEQKPWIPDWSNEDEEKYQPIFVIEADEEHPSGVGFDAVADGCAATYTRVGARHIFKSSKGLFHATTHFREYYLDLILIRK